MQGNTVEAAFAPGRSAGLAALRRLGRFWLAIVLAGWPPAVGLASPREAAPPASGTPETGEKAPADREMAPGVYIERAAPDPRALELRRRLKAWRPVYREQMAPVRGAHAELETALERSSLASSIGRCLHLLRVVSAVDRRLLFSSSDVRLDRVLFGALERYEAGASACLVGRFLRAHSLLEEAGAGLAWADRRLERELGEPIRLRGLDR